MPEDNKNIPIDQLLPRVRQETEQRHNGGPLMLHIAGQSAVGKSTTTAMLAGGLIDCSTLSMDAYLRGWSIGPLNHDSGDPSKPYYAGLNPNVYDLDRLKADLVMLKNGQGISQPIFDEVSSEPCGSKVLRSGSVVIVDGIYALMPPFLEMSDLSLLIEAPLHDRLIRKLIRNHLQYLQPINKIVHTYLSKDEPTYAYYQDELRAAADLVVVNPFHPNIDYVSLLDTRPVSRHGYCYTAVPKPQYGVIRPSERLDFAEDRGLELRYSVLNRELLRGPIDPDTFKLVEQFYTITAIK